MLLAAVHCCIVCRNFDVLSKFVLALLHFVHDFRISRLFSAALLHFLQEIQYLLLAVAY